MSSRPPGTPPPPPATDSWRPTATREALRRRAEVLATIRAFFAERGVLEVETPLLAAGTIPEPAIESLHTHLGGDPSGQPRKLYLQTSPEFAMKRLLAAGSGPIYQLCKSFRDGESGRRHNPEFTLLEWYRPGFDHHALMAEVDELVRRALSTPPAETITYGALFERHLGLDPFAAPIERLCQAGTNGGLGALPDLDRDGLLNLLMAAVIEPRLAHQRPLFVHDFPASQAALAKVRPGPPPVAERFELFVHTAATGTVELANGFHELADPAEQRRRFESDRSRRRAAGQGDVEPDARFLAALDHGLPACAGVALGVDRLVMLASGASRIEEVLAFPIDRA